MITLDFTSLGEIAVRISNKSNLPVWLPFMYTLQSHYLVRNPIDLSLPYLILVSVIGHAGYYVFRATNHQKDIVRRTNGDCKIWGKPVRFIRTGLGNYCW